MGLEDLIREKDYLEARKEAIEYELDTISERLSYLDFLERKINKINKRVCVRIEIFYGED